MKRRLISLLLSFAMIFTMLPMEVWAASPVGNLGLSITASKTEVFPGEEVILTVTMGDVFDKQLSCFDITVQIPDGLYVTKMESDVRIIQSQSGSSSIMDLNKQSFIPNPWSKEDDRPKDTNLTDNRTFRFYGLVNGAYKGLWNSDYDWSLDAVEEGKREYYLTSTELLVLTCIAEKKEGVTVATPSFEGLASEEKTTFITTYSDWEKVGPDTQVQYDLVPSYDSIHIHNLVKQEASGDCTTVGTGAYWKCSGCDKMYEYESDDQDTYETIDKAPEIPAGHICNESNWTDEEPATCYKEGTAGHYTCERCGKYIAKDQITVLTDLVIEKTQHKLTLIPKDDPSCTDPGKDAHYKCSVAACGALFTATGENLSQTGAATTDEELKLDALGHLMSSDIATPAKDPTCSEKGNLEYFFCERCDRYFNDKVGTTDITNSVLIDPVGHQYDKYTVTDTEHSRVCKFEGCGVIEVDSKDAHNYSEQITAQEYLKSEATCTSPAIYYKSCVCGKTGTETFDYGTTIEHPWQNTYEHDENQHWRECSVCTETTEKVNHSDADNLYATDGTNHWYVCKDCDQKYQNVAHDWKTDSEKAHLKSEATCTEPAYYWKVCSVCGVANNTDQYFSVGSSLDHEFTEEIINETHLKSPATCQSPAVYYYDCIRCDEKADENTVNGTFTNGGVADHNYEFVAEKTSGCKEGTEGTAAHYTCKTEGCDLLFVDENSNKVQKQASDLVLPLKQHTPGTDLTATEDGHRFTCTECNTQLEITPHTYVNEEDSEYLVEDKAATCTSQGEYYKSCEVCGYKGSETFNTPKLAHTVHQSFASKDATCLAPGNRVYSYCYNESDPNRSCGKYYLGANCEGIAYDSPEDPAIKIEQKNHELEHHAAEPATCTENGILEYWKCLSGCDQLYKANQAVDDNIITTQDTFDPAKGHTFTNTVDDQYLKTAATCTEKAVYYTSCSVCHIFSNGGAEEKTFENGNALGHLTTGVWVTTDDSQHWKVCGRNNAGVICDVLVEVGTHDYSKEVQGFKASDKTCTTPEKHYLQCECGKPSNDPEKTFAINNELKQHDFSDKIIDDTHRVSAATCTAAAVYKYDCKDCDAISDTTFTDGDPLGHLTTGAWVTTDDSQHWKVCGRDNAGTTCQEHVQVSNHNYSKEEQGFKASDKTCTTPEKHYLQCECGKPSNDPEKTFAINNELKQHDFSDKIIDDTHRVSAATCTAAAVYKYDCKDCDAISDTTFTDGDPLGHLTTGAWVTTDDSQHWKVCGRNNAGVTCDVYVEVGNHTYDQLVVDSKYWVSDATCKDYAKYKRSCICGKAGTDTFDHTEGGYAAHKFTAEDKGENDQYLATPATCTEDATYYKSCAVCGESSKDQTGEVTFVAVGSKLGHNFTEKIEDEAHEKSPADCQNVAVYYYDCARENCSVIATDADNDPTFNGTKKGDHNYGTLIPKQEPTCIAEGKKAHYKCQIEGCSKFFTEEKVEVLESALAIAMIPHTFTKEEVHEDHLVKAATCYSKATYYKSCTTAGCNAHGADTFEYGTTLPHTYGDAVVDGNKKTYTCQVTECKHTYSTYETTEDTQKDVQQGSDASVKVEVNENTPIDSVTVKINEVVVDPSNYEVKKETIKEEGKADRIVLTVTLKASFTSSLNTGANAVVVSFMEDNKEVIIETDVTVSKAPVVSTPGTTTDSFWDQVDDDDDDRVSSGDVKDEVKDALKKAEKNGDDKATVNINMKNNDSKEISRTLFSQLKKNPELTAVIKDKDYTWTIKGSDVKGNLSKAYFNTEVRFTTPRAKVIKKLMGDDAVQFVRVMHDGKLPGVAYLTLELDKDLRVLTGVNGKLMVASVSDLNGLGHLNFKPTPLMKRQNLAQNNLSVNCYYYNADSKSVELVASGLKPVNGKVTIAVDKGGDYFLTTETIKTSNDKLNPETGAGDPLDLSAVLVLAGYAMFASKKR